MTDEEDHELEDMGTTQELMDHMDYDISEMGLTRRRGRSIQRGISTARQSVVSFLPSRTISPTPLFSKNMESVDGAFVSITSHNEMTIDMQAAEIVRHMENDETLMEDNPVSEQFRIETLREMPESLTLKRTVKKKLTTSVNSKSKSRPISFSKRLKYQLSMYWTRVRVSLKNTMCGFELWYSSLKTIGGNFGSGVATYFKFLRWLFVLNLIVFIISLSFVVIPQLLIRLVEVSSEFEARALESNETSDENATFQTEGTWVVLMKDDPYNENDAFSFGNLLTGEGFLTDTELYYGFYSNMSLSLSKGVHYSIPTAYFFSALFCYLFVFITLSISFAVSYRRSFIETSGGLKNVFAHKIFCGWDFGIATEQAAELKSTSICTELRELLDETQGGEKETNWRMKFYTVIIRFSLNCLFIVLLIGLGFGMWQLLGRHMNNVEPNEHATAMMVSLLVTIIILLGPMFFSWIVQFESYESPRSALYVTLLRTFALDVVVIGVLVAFWLSKSTKSECWETSLGQEVYRLVLMDFLFGLIGTSLAEFVRARIYLTMWEGIGCPEFDIARNTMNLIYNQTLFYVGFYFSPILGLIIIIKMFLTFYIKKTGALYNCRSSSRSWRAAQTHTVFLAITFVAFFCVILTYAYILTSVRTSNCGPFRGYDFMYEKILNGILDLKKDSYVLLIILYLTKPGVVAIILVAMLLAVYYLRAKSLARRRVIRILRDMLLLQAKDKEFLLSNISKVTEGRWIYNLGKINGELESDVSHTWKYEPKISQEQGDNLYCVEENASTSGSSGASQGIPGSVSYIDRFREKNLRFRNMSDYPMFLSTHNVGEYEPSKSRAGKMNVQFGSAPHIHKYFSCHNVNNGNDGSRYESTTGLVEDVSDHESLNNYILDHKPTKGSSTQNLGFQTDELAEGCDFFPRTKVTNFNPVYTESELDQHSPPPSRTKPMMMSKREDFYNADDQRQAYSPHSYDDRVPSRIYFNNVSKDSPRLKKKY